MGTTICEQTNDVTIPNLALELRVNLDWLRRQFRRRPDLAGLSRRVGHVRVVRREDVDRVKELIGV